MYNLGHNSMLGKRIGQKFCFLLEIIDFKEKHILSYNSCIFAWNIIIFTQCMQNARMYSIQKEFWKKIIIWRKYGTIIFLSLWIHLNCINSFRFHPIDLIFSPMCSPSSTWQTSGSTFSNLSLRKKIIFFTIFL